MPKVLIIDDEDNFRESLSRRLKMRGYENMTLADGRQAVKKVRGDNEIDVVILDRKMPEISGEQVLKEIKRYRPELQVIMLTGFGSTESAMEVGKLDAYSYLEKPADIDQITSEIDNARQDKHKAYEKHDIPQVEKGSVWKWLKGTQDSRPGVIILGIIIFLGAILMPTPDRMEQLITTPKKGEKTDIMVGYSDYRKMETGENISDYYSKKYKLGEKYKDETGNIHYKVLTADETIFRVKVMLGILFVAALFWATGAVPIGITALVVGVFMYFLGVMQPDDVAQAYLKDSVIFIFGVLAFAVAITKTGLDRRIGIILLGSSKSIPMFLFIFLPLFSVACSFLSEHALVAFMMPVLMIIYVNAMQETGTKDDFKFAIMLFLAMNFAANSGGPGSPAAGGRNAIMLGILSDYGKAPTFGEWVQYGLPFVPVMAVCIGAYFYFTGYRKSKVRHINVSNIVKSASEKIGPMTRKEYITAAVLIMLVTLWITMSDTLGMGGPVIFALVLLNIFRILSWKNVSKIQWEVVALYAAATAMGKGLAATGAALYLADAFIRILPDMLSAGEGLAIAVSIFTGIATNFMSDGAAVSAIGPITVPMATISSTPAWAVGLTTAFASSFAHILVIGTPNNAIVYTMAKNPATGERLISLSDFIRHGFMVFLISMIVLWLWVILGYWQWIGF